MQLCSVIQYKSIKYVINVFANYYLHSFITQLLFPTFLDHHQTQTHPLRKCDYITQRIHGIASVDDERTGKSIKSTFKPTGKYQDNLVESVNFENTLCCINQAGNKH